MENGIVKKVGRIQLGLHILNVYDSLEDPLFLASEVRGILYGDRSIWLFEDQLEHDEVLYLNGSTGVGSKKLMFLTERGLYSALYKSETFAARAWRRVISDRLIGMRRERGMDICETFEEYDALMEDIYFDEETGHMMRSVTLPGGDVEQVVLDGSDGRRV
jgi:prophage antirepressor-like protein